MKVVVLYGRPAVGKLTVARELAALSGWRVFHNHLVVDALLAVFEFGSDPFVELREKIWREVFAEASRAAVPALIFTFSPESSVRQSFVDSLLPDAQARGDEVHLIELTCEEPEIEKRLSSPSRHGTKKITSLELYRQLTRDGAFSKPVLPRPEFSVDTCKQDPAEAARQIWHHLRAAPPHVS